MYDDSQNMSKPNNWKVFGSDKAKETKRVIQRSAIKWLMSERDYIITCYNSKQERENNSYQIIVVIMSTPSYLFQLLSSCNAIALEKLCKFVNIIYLSPWF